MIVLVGSISILLLAALASVAYFAYWYSRGRTVSISGQGYQLSARLYSGAVHGPATATVILFRGWSPGGPPWTPVEFYAPRLARDFGSICLTVWLRGMGSPGDIGSLTRKDFLEDATACYDYAVRNLCTAGCPVFVVGESFGSYLGCLLSTRRPVAGLSLRVPTDFPAEGFSDTPQVKLAGNLTREWKSHRHSPEESPALQAVRDFHGALQIVSSEKDEIVPRPTIDNYLSALPDASKVSYHEMRGAGHGLMTPIAIGRYYRLLSTWLASSISELGTRTG
jgi:uncharacterized protein